MVERDEDAVGRRCVWQRCSVGSSARRAALAAFALCVACVVAACADTARSSAVDSDGDTHNESMDCDDTNPAVHPDAAEVCNGTDDDCDGAIDEGLPVYTSWFDGDGDGYGDPDAPKVETCDEQARVVLAADCDDADPGIHAFAAENCSNGVDDDCDGWTDCEDWECAWSEPEQCEPTPSHLDREGTTTTAAATHRIDVEGLMPPIRSAVANPDDPTQHFVIGRVNTLNGQFFRGFVRVEPSESAGVLVSTLASAARGNALVTAVSWTDGSVGGLVDDSIEYGAGSDRGLSRFVVHPDVPSETEFERVGDLPDGVIHDLNVMCLHPAIGQRCDALIRFRPEEGAIRFDVWRDGIDDFITEARVDRPSFGGEVLDWYLSPFAPNIVVVAFDDGILLVDTDNEFVAREVAFTHPIAQPDLGYVQFGLDALAVRWTLDAQIEPPVVRVVAVDGEADLEEFEIALPSDPVQPPFAGLGPGRIGPDYQHVGDTDGDRHPEVLVLVRWPVLLEGAFDSEVWASTLLELDIEARSSRLESMFLEWFTHSLEGPHDWNGDGIDDITISDDDTMHLFFMR